MRFIHHVRGCWVYNPFHPFSRARTASYISVDHCYRWGKNPEVEHRNTVCGIPSNDRSAAIILSVGRSIDFVKSEQGGGMARKSWVTRKTFDSGFTGMTGWFFWSLRFWSRSSWWDWLRVRLFLRFIFLTPP